MFDVPRRQHVDVGTDWNRNDVRRPMWEHHRRKCYLCERPVGLAEFEVDHRVPRTRAEALIRCWLNLFPACRYCNGRRNHTYPERGGLLSPGLDSNLEARLSQRIERADSCDFRARFIAVDPDDLYADNTARELERLHDPESGTTDTSREGAQALLDAIEDHYLSRIALYELRALRARRRGQPDQVAEAELRRRLARDEPFTMLIRSMIHPELADLMH